MTDTGLRTDVLKIEQRYAEVRGQMLPGDLIAFGGKGRASTIIKYFTRSVVSHVGLVRQVRMIKADFDGEPYTESRSSRYFNEIIESTTLDGISGVQTSRLSRRLKQYNGEAWWLPLADEVRSRFNEEAYWDWLYAQDGKPYDTPQALGAGFDFLEAIGIGKTIEDFGKLFCSELAAGALREAGVLFRDEEQLESRTVRTTNTEPFICLNASEETPIQLCRRPVWKEPVQLKGAPMLLRAERPEDDLVAEVFASGERPMTRHD